MFHSQDIDFSSMDIVVVPTITLNPKKAKKKLKKAALSNDQLDVQAQLPVNNPTFGQELSSVKSISSKPSAPKVALALNRSTERKPFSKNQVSAPVPAKAVPVKQKVASPRPEVRPFPVASDTKRSWFDITEEDDDDFLGEQLPLRSGSRLVSA